MTRCLRAILVFLVGSPFAMAQMPKDNCSLSVRVRTNGEQRIESPIQVEVLSTQGVVATASIVGDQAAEFQVTSARTYRLKVSGSEIETVTTSYFEIPPLQNERTETVQVKLLNEKGEEEPKGSATVSLSEMNIPKKASAETKKGLDAYSSGDMEKAASHFERATAEYPRYARAYDMLGVIAIKKGDHDKARDWFSKSMEVDATYMPGYVDMARLDLQDRRYADAESLLEKAISLDPSTAEPVALLATAEFANKEYDKGLADVERTHALRGHEQFAEVHVMAGKVLAMQHEPDAAIAQFQEFLKEKPTGPEAESVRATIASLGGTKR